MGLVDIHDLIGAEEEEEGKEEEEDEEDGEGSGGGAEDDQEGTRLSLVAGTVVAWKASHWRVTVVFAACGSC